MPMVAERGVLVKSRKFKELHTFPGTNISNEGDLGCTFTFTSFETSEVLTVAGRELMI